MKEKAIKDAVRRYLNGIGAFWFMPVQMGYGATTVDFLVCHKGRFYGIETKRPSVTKVTPRQEYELARITEAGGLVCMENCPSCENVRRMIEEGVSNIKLENEIVKGVIESGRS